MFFFDGNCSLVGIVDWRLLWHLKSKSIFAKKKRFKGFWRLQIVLAPARWHGTFKVSWHFWSTLKFFKHFKVTFWHFSANLSIPLTLLCKLNKFNTAIKKSIKNEKFFDSSVKFLWFLVTYYLNKCNFFDKIDELWKRGTRWMPFFEVFWIPIKLNRK